MRSTSNQGSKTPGQMLKIGSSVVIVPILVLIFLIKVNIDGGSTSRGSMKEEMVLSRIAPVAKYNTGAPLPQDGGEEALTGEQVYNRLCMTCHDAGLNGAPIKGDTDAWAPRIAQGADLLFQHSLEGLNAMPAKGGDASLSDEEVKNAVVLMVNASGGDISLGDGGDDASADDSEDAAADSNDAAEAEESTTSTDEASAEEVAPVEEVPETEEAATPDEATDAEESAAEAAQAGEDATTTEESSESEAADEANAEEVAPVEDATATEEAATSDETTEAEESATETVPADDDAATTEEASETDAADETSTPDDSSSDDVESVEEVEEVSTDSAED